MFPPASANNQNFHVMSPALAALRAGRFTPACNLAKNARQIN